MKPAIEPVMRIGPSSRAHVAAARVDQVERAGDVGVDHVPRLAEVLIEERAAEAVPGVGSSSVDRPAAGRREKLVDAFDRREVGLDRLDARADCAKSCGGGFDRRLVGGDEEVEPSFAAQRARARSRCRSRRR